MYCIFIDSVPSPSDLAALAVITEYFSYLAPEQEKSVGKSWHETECFVFDMRYARRVSSALIKGHQDLDFQQAVASHEEALLEICKSCMPFNYDSQSNSVHSQFLGERRRQRL